jgi:sec-independent protein translocase protein TatA
MAWDDPIVWVLIVTAVIFLFGSNKIPELARAIGKAKREFDQARSGFMGAINSELNPMTATSVPPPRNPSTVVRPASPPGLTQPAVANPTPITDDPLLIAARNEGIDTRGKTKSQIATELASKLKDPPQSQ